MFGDILQPTHLIFILIVALVVLGPKRLPEVGRSLGRGLRDFKYALSTETPEHEYSSPSDAFAANPPEPETPVGERPAEPVVSPGGGSQGSDESVSAASGPAEHSS